MTVLQLAYSERVVAVDIVEKWCPTWATGRVALTDDSTSLGTSLPDVVHFARLFATAGHLSLARVVRSLLAVDGCCQVLLLLHVRLVLARAGRQWVDVVARGSW